MATLRRGPRGPRSNTFSKRFMVDTVRGVIRVRKWPRKRGKPKSPAQLFWIDWFTQANLLYKWIDPHQVRRFMEMTKGRAMYPRDVALKAMRGRLYTWTDENGWRWYPMAAVGDISETLDFLAQTVGSVLVRATDRWRTVIPKAVGDVLTYNGDIAPPTWETPAAAAPPFGGALVTRLSNQAIANVSNVAVIFDAESYDTDEIHDNSASPTRLTVPADWSKVRLTAGVIWASSGVGSRKLFIAKNGSPFPGHSQHDKLAVGNSQDSISTAVVDCLSTDYFELFVWQNTGAPLNLLSPQNNMYFSIERAA